VHQSISHLAPWSPWLPFDEAVMAAPKKPGVYLASLNGAVVYVGKAGLRDRGGKTTPKGIQGRLARYATGKAIASGLGEAVMDRALADPDWLRARLTEVEAGHPRRAYEWGRAAFQHAGLSICWATTPDAMSAHILERHVIAALIVDTALWNRTS
jgi:hypothetical protein